MIYADTTFLAQHQLNHTSEAQAALNKAADITRAKLPQLDSGDLGESWWDYLLAHMLLGEARTLIGDNPLPQQTNLGKP